MILYHGSKSFVEHPDVSLCRENTDFGRGFYTTTFLEQAKKWAERFKRRYGIAFVSYYFLDEEKLQDFSVLKFDDYSEDWLDFVVKSRKGVVCANYDLVIGGVANDKVFDCIELFFEGLINKDEALKRLKYEKANNQYCFKSQFIIDECLKLLKFEEIGR